MQKLVTDVYLVYLMLKTSLPSLNLAFNGVLYTSFSFGWEGAGELA